jgi:hypothetical protein
MENPRLIENSTRYYLYNNLKQCHINRVSIYYYVLNIGIFLLFIIITGIILYYCNKNKLTDYEKQQKILKDQQYVLSKIRYYKEDAKTKQESQYSGITGLPYIDMSQKQ